MLFEEDRKQHDSLSQKVQQLNHQIAKDREQLHQQIIQLDDRLNHPDEVKIRVEPVINHRLEHFVEEIPRQLGPTITEALRVQIKESKDQVVEALYPIIGHMIKKYLQREMQLLAENIDYKLDRAFSLEGWWERIKQWFGGPDGKKVVTTVVEAQIEEIYLIEKDSGILIGSYSRNQTLDQDMISGMLTAIKSFVEDAFQTNDQSLELIEYDHFKIHLQNFHRFYVAVVLSGAMTANFRNMLEDKILEFAERILTQRMEGNPEELSQNQFSNELKAYFDESNQ